LAKTTSDNARKDVIAGRISSKNQCFFIATGLEREGSTSSSEPSAAGGSSEPCVLAQPRASRNNGVGAILRRALVLLRRRGWRSTHWERDAGRGLSISEAIQRAGKAAADCYYAKLTLSAVLGFPFVDWESGQWRSQEEVFALLRRAAVVARGDAFAAHSGGWRVSSAPARMISGAPEMNVQPLKRRGA
jgi:hypothetical protein